ncbi:MAG TPA: hypothetical protein VF743_00375 [Acidimicrobiales bacterium]
MTRRVIRRGPPHRFDDDRGTGVVASVAALTVFLLFLLFSAQVLFGLYATSTVRATLHDAAARAAAAPAPPDPADLDRLAAEAEASLGPMGERTTIRLRLVDDDGDGVDDVVEGRAVAVPPRLVPPSLGGLVGDTIRVGVRLRLERFR